MSNRATALFADIFTVIDDAVWSERRALPQAAEARFWRAADELRLQPLTATANDLLTSIGLMLFRLRIAAFKPGREREMDAIRMELNEAGNRCLRELPVGCRLAVSG